MAKGTVWVTGASAGIGRAICLEMAANGWSVGAGSRSRERLRPLEEAVAGPGSIRGAELDVRSAASIDRWVATLRGETGEPDVVVNNAGWGTFAPVAETSEEDWNETIAVNLTGVFLVTRAVLPLLLARGRGQIVNVLSVAARTAFPKNGAYSASKFGALGLTEALRAEVRGAGIRVTAILPGATDTPFWDRLGGRWDRSRMMRPEAVARAVREAAEAGPEALVEEIRIAPPLGNL